MSAAAQTARFAAPVGMRPGWGRQSMDSVAAGLKVISDLTAQEVALLVGMVRERVSMRPVTASIETAGRIVTGATDAGKILLDLAAAETTIVAEGLKEILGLRPSLAAMVDLVPRGVGTLIDMHKDFLDAVAEQTHDVIKSFTEGKPLMAGARMSKAARQAIERFIATQKTFLDQVAEQVTIATEPGKHAKAAQRERSTLIQLSREGVERFIDAQKQILDLVMEQVEAENGRPHAKAVPRMSFAELTRKSVQNFTTAQKSLLDLALQPVPEVRREKKTRTARRKPKPRKPAVAEATATE